VGDRTSSCSIKVKQHFMKLLQGQTAPSIKTTDVFGNPVNLPLTGKLTYLAFLRNAGCAVCNLRTHQLLANAGKLRLRNIEVIAIFESTQDRMREYLTASPYPITFVADPANKLYKLYSIDRSLGKTLRSLANGMISKARRGYTLYAKRFSQDGHMSTIPSDFLIDESGKLQRVNYGKFIGDHLDLQTL
jgi:thioredoxin-dependent peroxiredoxin